MQSLILAQVSSAILKYTLKGEKNEMNKKTKE